MSSYTTVITHDTKVFVHPNISHQYCYNIIQFLLERHHYASKNEKLKFSNFSSDIDYSSKTEVFRDIMCLIINQCESRRTKGGIRGHKVSANSAAQASEASLPLLLKFELCLYIVYIRVFQKIG